jgi:hypothetical protein
MSRGGGQGPTRGGYYAISFSTQLVATTASSAGMVLGNWTVPTGARYHIVNAQAYSEWSGSSGGATHVGRVNVFVDTTSALSSEISLATDAVTQGTLTSAYVTAESASVIEATAAAGFGIGSAASSAQHVQVIILGFLSQHPNSTNTNFGTFDPTSQPAFGP